MEKDGGEKNYEIDMMQSRERENVTSSCQGNWQQMTAATTTGNFILSSPSQ